MDRRSPCPSCGSKARLYRIELKGEITFREKLKLKARHGKAGEVKPFLELQTGDDFCRKTGEWNRREKIEDRKNDRYYEHIVNPKTGEIVHHCEEPLSEHRGHGAARKQNTRTAQNFENSARRWEKRTGVWQAWKNWAAALKQDTYALYLAARDPRVPLAAKLVIVFVVAYALSPIDLIPDFIPVLGYLDDLLLLPMGIALAIKLMPRDVWEDCKSQARAELASELPRNRTAAMVIATVWLVLLGVAAWLAWRSLQGNPEKLG